MKNFDYLFKPQNVTDKLFKTELYPEEDKRLVKKEGVFSFSLALSFGSVYTVKFDELPEEIRAVRYTLDTPEQYEPCPDLSFGTVRDFICTPLGEGELLLINTNRAVPFKVFESPVILSGDTDDEWFYPTPAGDLNGNEGSWGDWKWTSDELIEKIYEPLRQSHPDYISREHIGCDESGKYDMWAYFFKPLKYTKTLFLTSGVHGNEFDGYLSLARFLEILTRGESDNEGLKYVRENVRLIVVPMVDVWSSHNEKWRFNCNEVDLNRDFNSLSQKESQNVAKLMKRHAGEISAVLDLHTSAARFSGLFYQFNMQAANSDVCRKVINHIYHRLLEKGYEREPDMSMIPGRYITNTCLLQGYAWNELGLPNIVVEHNEERWYPYHSSEAFLHAVECYGNFIIQTALSELL